MACMPYLNTAMLTLAVTIQAHEHSTPSTTDDELYD